MSLISRPSTSRGAATPAAMTLLFVVLMAAWLLWSGIYKPLIIGLGVFSCLLTVFLARQMGLFERSGELFQVFPKLPRYWWWLLGEILKSSWDVARLVLSPNLSISPTLVRIRPGTRLEMSQTILGNAITLSPGTVTLDVTDGELLVHCLRVEGAEDLKNGDAIARTRALESLP